MADLMFKRGKQAQLPSIGIDGCFYLTTDTNRLYVGQGENKAPVLLNQTVQVVDRVAALPPSPPSLENDFFYCIEENVLAVYHNGAWVQINTNTNDTVEVTDVQFGEGSVNDTKDAIQYTLTLSQTKYDINGSELEDDADKINPITATLTLKTSDIITITPEKAEVGLEASTKRSEADTSKNGVNIATKGSGSDSTASVLLVPGSNVDSIGLNSKNEIEINTHNTKYDVLVEAVDNVADVKLMSTDGEEIPVHYAAGTDLVVSTEQAGDAVDTVKFTHKTYNTQGVTISNAEQLDPEASLSYISGIGLSNGHVTSISTGSVKMPFDTHLVDGVSHDSNSWKATFADNNKNEWTIDFSGDAENLETNLKDYIDQGLAAANTALTFKGNIEHPDNLKTLTNVEVGDVYLLSKNQDTANYNYRVGDLFIAVSKGGNSGVLAAEDLEWTHVPAGDELIIDTRFAGVASVSGKAGVTDNENNGQASFHIEAQEDIQGDINTPDNNETLTLVAGQGLEIVNNTTSGSKEEVATIRHANITTTEPAASTVANAFEIVAVDNIDYDNGHITNISTKKYQVPTYDLSAEDNQIKLVNSIDDECGVIAVSGDTWITATADTNGLKVVHAAPNRNNPNTVTVSNSDALTQEGTLNIISEVQYDDKGHIVDIKTDSMTMPKDTTYEFYIGQNADGAAITNTTVNNPYLFLKDRNGDTGSAQLYADHTNLKVSGSSERVQFNLVWGSFTD